MVERTPTLCDTDEKKRALLAATVADVSAALGTSDAFEIAVALRGHGENETALLPDGLEEHDFDGENIEAALPAKESQ